MIDVKYTFSNELSSMAAKAAATDQVSKHLPLCAHLLDTCAVMDALVKKWLPFDSTNSLGISLDQFRKCALFLAAIHDLGKASPVFQSQISASIRNHEKKLASLSMSLAFYGSHDEQKKYGHHSLIGSQLLLHFAKCTEDLAVIVASHHGYTPTNDFCDFDDDENELEAITDHSSLFWSSERKSAHKWKEIQQELIEFAYKISDFSKKDPIIIPMHAQSVLTGLLIMADWLASNENYFPLIGTEQNFASICFEDRINKGIESIHLPGKWCPDNTILGKLFTERFSFAPRKLQEVILEHFDETPQSPKLVILEAPMGIGKTELALAMAERMAYSHNKSGLAFFLPSQATSNGIFARLLDWSKALEKSSAIAVRISHGNAHLNEPFCNVSDEIGTSQSLGMPDVMAHSFFKSGKSALLANIAVGTIDQLLLGSVAHRHVMLRHLGLTGKVVVIDECHAYDAYMSAFLDASLSILGKCGVPVILLSATLTAKRRSELNSAYWTDRNASFSKNTFGADARSDSFSYPVLTTDGKATDLSKFIDKQTTVKIERLENDCDSVLSVLKNISGCAGVIVNTVSVAQKLFAYLSSSCPEKHVVLCHSQYTNADRQRWEKTVLALAGKESDDLDRQNLVIIGTQVLEQSLDLDFDVLICEICPMDFLLQRIGRLHRHVRVRPPKCEIPKCFVLDEGMTNMGNATIYPKYLIKKTLDCIPNEIHLPEDISRLVEVVYSEQGNEIYGDLFQKFESERLNNYDLAKRYALKFNESRLSRTIAGKIRRDSCKNENGALVAVRQGTPALEVIVIAIDSHERIITLDGSYICESNDVKLSSDSLKKLLNQKLRLPHALSHAGIFESVERVLKNKSDTSFGRWRNDPLLRNELILPLKCSEQGYAGNFDFEGGSYELSYSQTYGLRTIKNEQA